MAKIVSSYEVHPQAIGQARLAGQVQVLPNQRAVVRLPMKEEIFSIGGRNHIIQREVIPQDLESHLTPIPPMVSKRRAEARIMDDIYENGDVPTGRLVNVDQEYGSQLSPQEQQQFLEMGFNPEGGNTETLRLMLKHGFMPAQYIPGA